MWEFDQSLGDRLEALRNPSSFEEITGSIRQEMEVLCLHEDPCGRHNRFFRFVYCIHVGQPLFDLFFNSVQGMRAAFYRSPYHGLEASSAFIESLRPALLRAGPLCTNPHIDAGESLNALSAKVWLSEVGKGLDDIKGKSCVHCKGEWSRPQDDIPEIKNGRWENSDEPYATYGRKAPSLTKLRVFGAFINGSGDEIIPFDKRHRARTIHEVGWS
jgi:hypothetical protein